MYCDYFFYFLLLAFPFICTTHCTIFGLSQMKNGRRERPSFVSILPCLRRLFLSHKPAAYLLPQHPEIPSLVPFHLCEKSIEFCLIFFPSLSLHAFEPSQSSLLHRCARFFNPIRLSLPVISLFKAAEALLIITHALGLENPKYQSLKAGAQSGR